jgi:hypothetical protein
MEAFNLLNVRYHVDGEFIFDDDVESERNRFRPLDDGTQHILNMAWVRSRRGYVEYYGKRIPSRNKAKGKTARPVIHSWEQ